MKAAALGPNRWLTPAVAESVRTRTVHDDVGEGRRVPRGAQRMRCVHPVFLELLHYAITQAVATDFGEQGWCQAQPGGRCQRIRAVAAALDLRRDQPCMSYMQCITAQDDGFWNGTACPCC